MDDKGCNVGNEVDAGTLPNNGLVVMLYGGPVKFADGSWGATAFGFPDRKTGEIRDAMKAWGGGFFRCLSTPGQYKIAIGTSNDFPSGWDATQARNHAEQWASMVDNVQSYFEAQGWTGSVLAYGASNMELGFDGPVITKAWANAYDGTAGREFYFNLGDAESCQTFSGGDGSSCGSANYPTWVSGDLYDISWGINAALPLPQIYNEGGTNAEQWVMVSKTAIDNGKLPMKFEGPLTQESACNQKGGCSGTKNAPWQAWNQMVNKMDAKPVTIKDMLHSTDIKWQNP